jgi:hypothetical protein
MAVVPSTVTIDALTKVLGEGFPLLQAVAYLSSAQAEGLSAEVAVLAPSVFASQVAAPFFAGACLLAAIVTVTVRSKATEQREDSYAALLQA